MNNFTFLNDTKILFGKGQIAAISSEIPQHARILLTYGGGSIKKNGVYNQVVAALKGFSVVEFSGIEPNPSYEKLMEAIDIIAENKIDFLLAVGGGSVIDGTKFIAAAYKYKGIDPWEILSKGAIVEEAMPLGCVLTLPATGTEMNGNSVVSRKSNNQKLAFGSNKVLPRFSVLDPEVIFSLPTIQIANGVADAFVHVMEQYMTYSVDAKIQDRFAESVLQTLIEDGPKVLANKTNYDAAANYMWAATMALNGLIGVGVPQDWTTHTIGHEITALYGVDHAQTLTIVLPGVMNCMRESKKDKLLQFAERIWNITEGDSEQKIDQCIAMTETFFKSLGLKVRLSEHEIPHSSIETIVSRLTERGVTQIGEKRLVGTNEIRSILEQRF